MDIPLLIFGIIVLIVVIIIAVNVIKAEIREKKHPSAPPKSPEQIKADYLKEIGLNPNKSISFGRFYDIFFDDSKQKFTVYRKVYDYSDIIDYELIENGETYKKSGNGLMRAVVGGALFGGVGAIVGASTTKTTSQEKVNSLYINIFLKGGKLEKINFIDTPTEINGFDYTNNRDKASNLIAILADITKNNEVVPAEAETKYSEADEIAKFKKLYDDGTITYEEFEAKKKQLLNL